MRIKVKNLCNKQDVVAKKKYIKNKKKRNQKKCLKIAKFKCSAYHLYMRQILNKITKCEVYNEQRESNKRIKKRE